MPSKYLKTAKTASGWLSTFEFNPIASHHPRMGAGRFENENEYIPSVD